MTNEQISQYKKNYIDNAELEFVCRWGRVPAISSYQKWSKEADAKLSEMIANMKKWQKA